MLSATIKKIKSAPKLLGGVLLPSLLVGIIFFATSLQNSNKLQINGQQLTIERATTQDDQARGLCCRDYLPPDHGMLFVYDQPAIQKFWMKDTRIPLDMYWLDSDKQIIHIERSVQPSSYPKSFGPNKPAQYVLETNAGYARRYNIRVGNVVQF